MEPKKLNNPPLVEAIFEIKWVIPGDKLKAGIVDPSYQILAGKISGHLESQYPTYEALPTLDIPIQLVTHQVQHRFRSAQTGYPLIQFGPGILTVNDTENYIWDDFFKKIEEALKILYRIHPLVNTLSVQSVSLRYIDALEFDFDNNNILTFLEDYLKISTTFADEPFQDTNITNKPVTLDIRYTFPKEKPKGVLHLQFRRGQYHAKDALIWETTIQSAGKDAPQKVDEILHWNDLAHKSTHKLFFGMIKGKLEEKFK